MTPVDFADGLADAMAVSRTELATVDRELAKAGLRKLARGKRRPDITLAEGVQLACAWAGAVKVTSAVDAVEHLNTFHFAAGDLTSGDEDLSSDLAKAERDADCQVLFGAAPEALTGRTYIDAAAMLARQIGLGSADAEEVTLSIEKQGKVAIVYGTWMNRRVIQFDHLGKLELGKRRPIPMVSVTVSIRGPVLKWIYDNTEGA